MALLDVNIRYLKKVTYVEKKNEYTNYNLYELYSKCYNENCRLGEAILLIEYEYSLIVPTLQIN